MAQRLALHLTWANILRIAGMIGIAYITINPGKRDPSLVVLFGAMAGAPWAKHLDDIINTKRSPPSDSPPS